MHRGWFRESPPTTGDAESLELGVRRAPVTMQGLTGCSQQPGHGATASAAHGSGVNTFAGGRPPPATVAPQGSCVQDPHRLAYSAYRGGVKKWGRKAREGIDSEAPAHKRLHVGQQPKADSRDESGKADDSCCGSGLEQGAIADTEAMQAKVQTLRSRGEYRNAGLAYAAAKSLVVMKQQSREAWARRDRLETVLESLCGVWLGGSAVQLGESRCLEPAQAPSRSRMSGSCSACRWPSCMMGPQRQGSARLISGESHW